MQEGRLEKIKYLCTPPPLHKELPQSGIKGKEGREGQELEESLIFAGQEDVERKSGVPGCFACTLASTGLGSLLSS